MFCKSSDCNSSYILISPNSFVDSCGDFIFLLCHNVFMVKHNTLIYSCKLLVHRDCGPSRCTRVWYRSYISMPVSPAASKLLLSWTHASMSSAVYPFCSIKWLSHSVTLGGEEQEEWVEKLRLDESREGPHLVRSSGESESDEKWNF